MPWRRRGVRTDRPCRWNRSAARPRDRDRHRRTTPAYRDNRLDRPGIRVAARAVPVLVCGSSASGRDHPWPDVLLGSVLNFIPEFPQFSDLPTRRLDMEIRSDPVTAENQTCLNPLTAHPFYLNFGGGMNLKLPITFLASNSSVSLNRIRTCVHSCPYFSG